MYDVSSWFIIVLLGVLLVLAIEVGYRLGRRFEVHLDASTKAQISSLQASMLGILALLLGFTYSLSLERFDSRSDAVVDEALAIENAYFRSRVLPSPVGNKAQTLIHEYLDLRINASGVALEHEDQRDALFASAKSKLDALSECALESASEDGSMVHSGLFIESLNELTDAFGRREAALERHVPALVLCILFATIILTGFVVGHASGIDGHRVAVTTYGLVVLIFLVVYLILDLDRPRRGFIQVQQQSLTILEESNNLNKGAMK